MATTITPVDSDHISHALFIDMQIGGNVFYFSNAYKPITIDSNTYDELGSFLAIDDITENIKSSEADLSITLSGIPSDEDYLSKFLNERIKGGNVTIQRGFFYTGNSEIQTDQIYTRYKGVITNFGIDDNAQRLADRETATITVSCSNIQTILKNQISGRRTSPDELRRNSGATKDKVFDNIPNLYNTSFDFGKEYTSAYTGGGGYGGGGTGGGGNRGRSRNVRER